MRVVMVRHFARYWLAAALIFPTVALAQSAPDNAAGRVVVLDVFTPLPGAEISGIPDLIADWIRTRTASLVVPQSELRPAIDAHERETPGCSQQPACALKIANAVHATGFVVSAFRKTEDGKFELALSYTSTASPSKPIKATETMRQVKSLSLNVDLCLQRLFEGTAPAAPAAAASAAASAAEPKKDAVPAPLFKKDRNGLKSLALIGVSRGEGFSEQASATVEEILLSDLHDAHRFNVIGRSDIATLLSFEAQKQMMNCNESVDCATQIAGALGVDYVATATIGRLGATIILSLKVIDVRAAATVGRAQQKVKSDGELPDAAGAVAIAVVREMYPDWKPDPGMEPAPTLATPVQTAPVTPLASAAHPALAESPAPKTDLGPGFAATWVMAGTAVAAAAVAIGTGVEFSKCPKVEQTPVGFGSAASCQDTYGTTSNVAWAVTAASAAAAVGLVFTWAPKLGSSSSATPDKKVTIGFTTNSVIVAARF